MFCCNRKQAHRGQIVTSLCLEVECIRNRNQLSCSLCSEQDHHNHHLTSLSKVIPQLLEAKSQKNQFKSQLVHLLDFVCNEFGEENQNGGVTNLSNIIQRAQNLLMALKEQVELNNQQLSKMKNIFKTLNRNNQQSPLRSSIPSRIQQEYILPNESPSKVNNQSAMVIKSNQSSASKSKMGNYIQQATIIHELDCFSHSAKHPYLSISSDSRTATKVSHSGHRFAAIGAKCFSQLQHQLHVKIDKSVSGNIMVGLCHESVVREKQYCNSYGIGTGTYLIGQNGNSPATAISFHHSLAVMNRKQVVGWNFQEGDSLIIGVNFNQNYIYFRKQGKASQQFAMKISNQDTKPELKSLIAQGFKFITLLQSQGDQVSIIEQ